VRQTKPCGSPACRPRTRGCADTKQIKRRSRRPGLDQSAAIAAVREGKDPPPPTAGKLEAEADTARRALTAANNIATQAAADLERAIRAHRVEWLKPQCEDAVTRAQDALDLVDQIEAAIGRLGESAGIARTLGTAPPPGPAIERGRTFKRYTVAQANGKTAPNLITDLREAITFAVPKPPHEPSVAEQLEADEFKRRQRGLRDVGRGVAVT